VKHQPGIHLRVGNAAVIETWVDSIELKTRATVKGRVPAKSSLLSLGGRREIPV